ncbi:MAG TPA: formylglycine-generating enzyme family protein [Pirellulales bacterium]|nr:formylglycine-generating enzyme family protein [Pirellulales bacterium]
MKLALIPPGEFWMGAADEEQEAAGDEKPRHLVRITKAFRLGVYEVTQHEYQKVMGTNPSWNSAEGVYGKAVVGLDTARFPVENVSWHEAREYCRRLSELRAEKEAGRVYRLPTEGEWEYACRAGTTTPFDFGSSLDGKQANCNGNFPYGTSQKGPYVNRPQSVGSYNANPWDLYDMHGNVWEWCSDAKNSYVAGVTVDPSGATTPGARVVRGGAYRYDAVLCRSARRFAFTPETRHFSVGFRVACDP